MLLCTGVKIRLLSQGWKERCIKFYAFEHLDTKSSGDQFLSFSQVYLNTSNKTFSLLYLFIFRAVFKISGSVTQGILFFLL